MYLLLIAIIALPVGVWALLSCRLRRGGSDQLYSTKFTRKVSALGLLWLVALWFALANSGLIASAFLAGPEEVIPSLYKMVVSGEIFIHIGASLFRVVAGFLIAALPATVIGLAAGSSSLLRAVVLPQNSTLRYIPPTVFTTLLILWFGIGETSKILLISLGTVFYLTQMITDVVNKVPLSMVEYAKTVGLSSIEVAFRVRLPASAPGILDAWRVNFGASWIFLVVAELTAAEQGLGHLIAVSYRFLNIPRLYTAIAILGILGFLCDSIFDRLNRHYFFWHVR